MTRLIQSPANSFKSGNPFGPSLSRASVGAAEAPLLSLSKGRGERIGSFRTETNSSFDARQCLTPKLLVIALFLGSMPAMGQTLEANTSPTTIWHSGAQTAISQYRSLATTALCPIHDQLELLRTTAADAGQDGSLLPPSPLASLDSYLEFHVLAAIPEKWKRNIIDRAHEIRAQGVQDRSDGKQPSDAYRPFEDEFLSKPRGLDMPVVPWVQQDTVEEPDVDRVLSALQRARSTAGTPEAAQARRLYEGEANRFNTLVTELHRTRIRPLLMSLQANLTALAPAEFPSLEHLPPDLAIPYRRLLASHYFEGHTGNVLEIRLDGTGEDPEGPSTTSPEATPEVSVDEMGGPNDEDDPQSGSGTGYDGDRPESNDTSAGSGRDWEEDEGPRRYGTGPE